MKYEKQSGIIIKSVWWQCSRKQYNLTKIVKQMSFSLDWNDIEKVDANRNE